MLREYQEEISRLRAQLEAQTQGGTVVGAYKVLDALASRTNS